MKKILPLLFGIMCLAPVWHYPVAAATGQCDRTLKSIKASLPDVKVFELSKIPNSFGKPPQGRSKYLSIRMQSDSAEALMKKEEILLKTAKTAIASCPQLGLVSFGISETDWEQSYGLKNGKVQAFRCSERRPLRWGEFVCV
jgi:hypothetical protein